MPAPRSHRNLLPSTNAALEALEAATGQPVTIVEDPELSVAATMRRARPSEATHIFRRRSGSGSDPEVDYLITFQCRMALRDVAAEEIAGRRQAFADLPAVIRPMIAEIQVLYPDMAPVKTRELGQLMVSGLLLQLRSMGPGMVVDRWIREHCPDLRQSQEEHITSQINGNLSALQAGSREQFPVALYDGSVRMNGAYAVFGAELLGRPHLAVPYLSQGYGPIARELIGLAFPQGEDPPGDRNLIDGWARALGLEGWYEWVEVPG